MKRIYKSCVAVLLLLAMLLSCVPALAAGSSHSYTTLQKAEALKTLGLFQGTNKGFELEKTLTREQAITLIVRLLGAEAEAKEKNLGSHTGEETAAIAMALHEYLNDAHDVEDMILTINKVKRTYSPWSSKIYTLRQTPKR